VTCLTLQEAPGNIEQNISIILVARTYDVSVRIFSVIVGIYSGTFCLWFCMGVKLGLVITVGSS
jgi:hypothetical protein